MPWSMENASWMRELAECELIPTLQLELELAARKLRGEDQWLSATH